MNWQQFIREPRFWVVGIAAGLIAIQLNLVGKFDQMELFGTSTLAWGAVSFLIWDKRESLNLESGVFSSFFGASLIALVLLRIAPLSEYDAFLRLTPLISAVGLGLLASGFAGLKQYWQELTVLGFTVLSPAPTFLHGAIDLTTITAKASAIFLWYMGFPVSRQGVYLVLPNGTVEVGSGCSGLSVIMQMLMLAVVFLFMFPTNLKQKILVPVVAVLVGFVVNVFRVALMAFLVAYSQQNSFEYWHFGEGSVIFSMISAAIFGLFCQFAILRDAPENQDAL